MNFDVTLSGFSRFWLASASDPGTDMTGGGWDLRPELQTGDKPTGQVLKIMSAHVFTPLLQALSLRHPLVASYDTQRAMWAEFQCEVWRRVRILPPNCDCNDLVNGINIHSVILIEYNIIQKGFWEPFYFNIHTLTIPIDHLGILIIRSGNASRDCTAFKRGWLGPERHDDVELQTHSRFMRTKKKTLYIFWPEIPLS